MKFIIGNKKGMCWVRGFGFSTNRQSSATVFTDHKQAAVVASAYDGAEVIKLSS